MCIRDRSPSSRQFANSFFFGLVNGVLSACGRATFAADYSLGPGEAPLLSFDPGNWEAPFAVPEE